MAAVAGIIWTLEMLVIFSFPFLQKQSNQIVTVLWTCIIATSLSTVLALTFEDVNLYISWTDWLLVFGHSGTFGFGILVYMHATSVIPGTLNSLIGTTSTVYVVIAQYSLLASVNPGNRNLIEILGVLLVLVSSILPTIFTMLKARSKSKEEMLIPDSDID